MFGIYASKSPSAPRLRRAAGALGVLGALLLLVPAAGAQDRSIPQSFADLAERVTPAVVNISTTRAAVAGRQGEMPFSVPEDSPFADLFRRFWEQRQRPTRALGSGFITSADGHVATNNHVIDGADEITVTLHDGREFKAKVVGTDRTTDLALLKIEAGGDLPHVTFGDSSKTRVGDWVMAVGNPFNLGGTVTVGVLSARNRDLRSGPYDDYLQIDAPINRGNSGGPLFNTAGEVIGVNTAIYSTTGGNIGIGFAIPSSMASKVLNELRDKGKVERGWLGVYIQPMTEDLAKGLGLDRARGALVAQVQEDSPAAKAGIKSGDVILSVDGQTVDQSRNLARMVAEMEPGRTVELKVWRNREETGVQVKLETLDERAQRPTGRDEGRGFRGDRDDRGFDRDEGRRSYGLMLGELTDAARNAYDIPSSVAGVLIGRVAANSPAYEQGLRPGDVMMAVDGEAVTRVRAALDRLRTARREGRPAVLLISRQGVTRFVVLRAVSD
jgi:serine protease Do